MSRWDKSCLTEPLPFNVGDHIDWLHGEHYRVGTVMEIKDDKVLISGSTTDYWISLKSLLPRLSIVPRSKGGWL